MFIMSMKMGKKQIIILITVIIFIILGLFIGLKFLAQSKSDIPQSTVTSLEFNTQEDIKNYIKSFGWEIEENPVEVVDVLVPNEFNDVYTNYNEIQKQQGFDLEKYKGKTATRYTFVVINYPNMPDHIRADVITCGSEIIASDICSVELDGFMYPIDSFPK